MLKWVEVRGPGDTETVKVAYAAYANVWRDRGYELVTLDTTPPKLADPKETDDFNQVFDEE